MFDYTFWFVFFSAAFALNLSPGPDLIYILSRTIAQGKKIGIASALGVCTGALFHVIFVSLGFSAILAASTTAFTIIKYVGASYLIYLGIDTFRSCGSRFNISAPKGQPVTLWKAFYQGMLIDVLNPKVAIFFIAFLPQFVRPDLGNPTLQIAGLGILVIFVAIGVEITFVLAAERVSFYFRSSPKAAIWLDRILGSILIGLGIRLIF